MPEQNLHWADAERAAAEYLGGWLHGTLALADSDVTTETRATVPDEYVVVERVGGRRVELIDRVAELEVRVHARSRGRMWEIARAVETGMAAVINHAMGSLYVDDLEETFGFAIDPMPSQDVRRASATYTLTFRPDAG